MVLLANNIYAVQVPDDAHHFCIYDRCFYYCLPGMSVPTKSERIVLSEGNWCFLFTTKGATPDQARKVVGNGEWDEMAKQNLYRVSESRIAIFKVDDPAIALTYLLKSKGLNTKNNHALIQNDE